MKQRKFSGSAFARKIRPIPAQCRRRSEARFHIGNRRSRRACATQAQTQSAIFRARRGPLPGGTPVVQVPAASALGPFAAAHAARRTCVLLIRNEPIKGGQKKGERQHSRHRKAETDAKHPANKNPNRKHSSSTTNPTKRLEWRVEGVAEDCKELRQKQEKDGGHSGQQRLRSQVPKYESGKWRTRQWQRHPTKPDSRRRSTVERKTPDRPSNGAPDSCYSTTCL